jgi:hypothetical protein
MARMLAGLRSNMRAARPVPGIRFWKSLSGKGRTDKVIEGYIQKFNFILAYLHELWFGSKGCIASSNAYPYEHYRGNSKSLRISCLAVLFIWSYFCILGYFHHLASVDLQAPSYITGSNVRIRTPVFG